MLPCKEIEATIRQFEACTGPFIARDAKTNEEKRVRRLENRSAHQAELAVLFEDGTERVFTEDYDSCRGPGSYMLLWVKSPSIEGCVPTHIEIHDGGMDDYWPPDGLGKRDPVLALTLVNLGAEAANAPFIAEDARQRALAQRRAQDARNRAREEIMAHHKKRADEISSQLVGKRVKEAHAVLHAPDHILSLELTLDDGTTLKIRARHDHSLDIETKQP